MTDARLEVSRLIAASPGAIFAVLREPSGHVAIDSSGMLQSSDGAAVEAVGDEFVVHMDRESLGDVPLGKYDVTVIITRYKPDAEIEWTVGAFDRPRIGHLYGYRLEAEGERTRVTSYYDWSALPPTPELLARFPVVPEFALGATLGILARVVEQPT